MPFPCLGNTSGADLLVLILSRPTVEGALARSQLRRTWAQWHSPTCVVRFRYVLGRPPDNTSDEVRLLATASREPEVMLVNASDGYTILSHKVFAAFTLAVERESFAYLLKTDDDSYVCIGGMLRWLLEAQRKDAAVTEWLYGGTPVTHRCEPRGPRGPVRPLFGQIGQARGSHASLAPLPPSPLGPPLRGSPCESMRSPWGGEEERARRVASSVPPRSPPARSPPGPSPGWLSAWACSSSTAGGANFEVSRETPTRPLPRAPSHAPLP